ncbi:hypothetical protein BN946_scf184962.g73 [Trametes cinnabarina]|uniref:Uncharacterized protein n=1 Tax=Pycnoporus cinnabarinus TaxID=5643 RepID=A0A060SCP3_PYCCI|nr:hypothetical protein BN946_scf184962.g73 [Trametes cinnabarina]
MVEQAFLSAMIVAMALKHVLLASEIYVYFILAVLDLLTHTLPSIGSSLDSFRSLDIIIGAGSFIPLFLYTFSLYLLTSTELVPTLPVKLQRIAKYSLLSFIPLIVLLNELGSFVGITYRSFGGNNGVPLLLGVGFTDSTAEMFLSTVTLVLLTAFQALNFSVAFFRLVVVLMHKRNIESSGKPKELETHVFRGLGWLVVGLKLGAIETVIGFAQGGFGVAMARRVLRFLVHACLIVGILKGVDTVEDFQLYSPSEAQRRRKSMLRAMIQNPRFSTFRHVGGHDFDAEKTFAPKRDSVIRVGDPSWMRRDFNKASIQEKAEGQEERATPGLLSARKSSSLTFKIASHFSIKSKTSSRKSKASTYRDSTSSFGSSKRNSWPPQQNTIEEEQDEERDLIATEFSPVSRPPMARASRQRVTVHIRKDRLPVLELRRFSNLDFLDLITTADPFRDPQGRARSLPGNFEELDPRPVGHVSASFTRLPAYAGVPAPPAIPVRTRSMHESVFARHARSMSVSTYDRPASVVSNATVRPPSVATYKPRDSGVSFQPRISVVSSNARDSTLSYDQPPSATSFHAIGTPAEMEFYAIGTPGTATTFDAPESAATANGPRLLGLSRRERGLSSSTTASEVNALTAQFPGIPMRPVAVPRPRSMLSHEVQGTEFIVDQDAAASIPTNPFNDSAAVNRVQSVKRKAVPALDEVEASHEPAEPSNGGEEIRVEPEPPQERVITELEATQSLPTPVSPPHAPADSRWPVKRAHTLPASQKRRPPPPGPRSRRGRRHAVRHLGRQHQRELGGGRACAPGPEREAEPGDAGAREERGQCAATLRFGFAEDCLLAGQLPG